MDTEKAKYFIIEIDVEGDIRSKLDYGLYMSMTTFSGSACISKTGHILQQRPKEIELKQKLFR